MALSFLWISMVLLSIIASIFYQNSSAVSAAALMGAQSGVTLGLSIAGSLCLWSGLAKLMEQSGLAEKLAKLLFPFLRRHFPETFRDKEAREAICANFTANLLGLGNAATPMGVHAVRRMAQLSGSQEATNEMCRLIVLNTASIQLLPTTVAALRASLGAERPFVILPAVWLSSLFSVSMGLLAARAMEGRAE